MRGLLIVLVLVVAGAVGLGFYLGWFHLTVDKDKFQEDKQKALEKVQDLGHQVKDKAAVPTEQSKDQAAPPVQLPQNQP